MKNPKLKSKPKTIGKPKAERRVAVQRVVIPAARIFSGDSSVKMWEGINGSKTVRDLRMALYVVCCRLQELEEKVERKKRV